MYGQIAAMLRLTPAQMQIKDGEGYKWQHDIRWAISALCRSMAIRNYGHSKYSITDFGRKLLEEKSSLAKTRLPSRKWWLFEVAKLRKYGNPTDAWNEMVRYDVIELPDNGLGDLSNIKQRPDILSRATRIIGENSESEQAKAIIKLYWSFHNTIEQDNYVFARSGAVLLGYGTVASDYHFVRGNLVRSVRWNVFENPVPAKLDDHMTLQSLKAGSKERLRVEKAIESAGLMLYV